MCLIVNVCVFDCDCEGVCLIVCVGAGVSLIVCEYESVFDCKCVCLIERMYMLGYVCAIDFEGEGICVRLCVFDCQCACLLVDVHV